MPETAWTHAAAHVPQLTGQGFYFAAPRLAGPAATRLQQAGYRVATADGSGFTDLGSALSGLSAALGLPASAGNNLDAFADSLDDLDGIRVALQWQHAEMLAGRDIAAWTRIARVLAEASDSLWDADSGTGVVFETIAFFDGFGVGA